MKYKKEIIKKYNYLNVMYNTAAVRSTAMSKYS
jgi:hypothetical protein